MITVQTILSIKVRLSDDREIEVLPLLPEWAFDSLDQALDEVIEPMINWEVTNV